MSERSELFEMTLSDGPSPETPPISFGMPYFRWDENYEYRVCPFCGALVEDRDVEGHWNEFHPGEDI